MSASETIIRIAAKGDGITQSGKFVSGAAPGDIVQADGTLEHGPHHQTPPCRHFGKCGGCQLQHLDDEALSTFVRDRVAHAAEGQGMTPGKLAEPHVSPPQSRRRVSLHAVNGGGKPSIGFREGGSHRLVDLRECHVMRAELFAMIAPLRAFLARKKGKYAIDIELAIVDQGVDCLIKGLTLEGLQESEAMADFCRDNALARMTLDQGYGAETLWEPEPVSVTLGGVPVPYPAGTFLQATIDGEAALMAAAQEWLKDSRFVADLFAGLGTFAFALAGDSKVLAAEAAQQAFLACKSAAGISRKPVLAMHRDLFRNPIRAEELKRFDAVVLDPPRAGAKEQIAQIVESGIARVVYISCNPSSWARDSRSLADAGYRLAELRPVGQFRWSTHVELASFFLREDAEDLAG
ncbi:class I SAM-dependent RNA methyltransferase [Altericroceibacterium endophyticum]|uniref:Class I SAM-dependent RNA methyltransferase n=1 Tax=Altericroceibacterium endophyticum TaxID=1808508 RepID=A0A6I4T6H9_9SPHN|nr:class I SAM-dependent RNA methyltransferase [Altericroceibacterium endophyticum]